MSTQANIRTASEPAVACTALLACAWEEHDDGRYDTGCDNAFEFTWGTPEDNDFKWCPFCGKSITVQANDRGQAQTPTATVPDKKNV